METIKSYLFKWNNLEKVWSFNFYSYLENRQYCDCSLAAEGKFISAHKIILSACSDYFREMFELGDQQPSRIIVLADVTYEDLISVLEFAYKGEVMVKSENYERFLKVAKLLQLKGISDRTSVLPPTAPLSPPPVISLPDRSLTSEIIESSLELELPEIKTESESSPVRKGLKRKAQSIDHAESQEKSPMNRRKIKKRRETMAAAPQFSCKFCKKKYSKKSVNCHEKFCKLNPDRVVPTCEICFKPLSRPDKLVQHMKSVHSKS